MKLQETQSYDKNSKIYKDIINEISLNTSDNQLACEAVFKISKKFSISTEILGQIVDDLNIRLIKCQLGLFGYYPNKKIIKPASSISLNLKKNIELEVIENKISCKKVWEIAKNLKISKIDVSESCESLLIKIKPCQLGAF